MDIQGWLKINMPTFFGWLDKDSSGDLSEAELSPLGADAAMVVEAQKFVAKLGEAKTHEILAAATVIGTIPHHYRNAVILAREAGKLEELLEKSVVAKQLDIVRRELNRVYTGVVE